MVRRTAGVALLAIAGLLARPAPAGADGCSEADVGARAERIEYARAVLEREERLMARWTWAWGLGFTAAAIGQTGAGLLVSDKGQSVDLYVSAAKSGVGAIFTAIDSPRVRAPRTEPDDGGCEALAAAEAALFAAAAEERRGRRAFVRVGAAAINVAALLYLGLAHDRWGSGLLGAGVGIAVGEIKIRTQPTGAIEAERRYRAGSLDRTAGGEWGLVAGPGALGLSVGGTF